MKYNLIIILIIIEFFTFNRMIFSQAIWEQSNDSIKSKIEVLTTNSSGDIFTL
jgi:hypothetical protein